MIAGRRPSPVHEASIRLRTLTDRGRERRELRRLQDLPRRTRDFTTLQPPGIALADGASFVAAYETIFRRQAYRFPCRNAAPRIIDCGANIGLATLFFARVFPNCRLTAFEPDPQVFGLLQDNCANHGVDAELVNAAVWSSEGVLDFWSEGADAGRLGRGGDGHCVQVPTTCLAPYLEERVDLLKVDIEGAEYEVLLDCREQLRNVEHLFVEIHTFTDGEQRAGELLSLLSAAGFRYTVEPEAHGGLFSERPFLHHRDHMGMDNQVNVFAFRD